MYSCTVVRSDITNGTQNTLTFGEWFICSSWPLGAHFTEYKLSDPVGLKFHQHLVHEVLEYLPIFHNLVLSLPLCYYSILSHWTLFYLFSSLFISNYVLNNFKQQEKNTYKCLSIPIIYSHYDGLSCQ